MGKDSVEIADAVAVVVGLRQPVVVDVAAVEAMDHCCWSVDRKADAFVAGLDVVVVAAAVAGAKLTQTRTTHQMAVSLSCSRLWN